MSGGKKVELCEFGTVSSLLDSIFMFIIEMYDAVLPPKLAAVLLLTNHFN